MPPSHISGALIHGGLQEKGSEWIILPWRLPEHRKRNYGPDPEVAPQLQRNRRGQVRAAATMRPRV